MELLGIRGKPYTDITGTRHHRPRHHTRDWTWPSWPGPLQIMGPTPHMTHTLTLTCCKNSPSFIKWTQTGCQFKLRTYYVVWIPSLLTCPNSFLRQPWRRLHLHVYMETIPIFPCRGEFNISIIIYWKRLLGVGNSCVGLCDLPMLCRIGENPLGKHDFWFRSILTMLQRLSSQELHLSTKKTQTKEHQNHKTYAGVHARYSPSQYTIRQNSAHMHMHKWIPYKNRRREY